MYASAGNQRLQIVPGRRRWRLAALVWTVTLIGCQAATGIQDRNLLPPAGLSVRARDTESGNPTGVKGEENSGEEQRAPLSNAPDLHADAGAPLPLANASGLC